MITLLALLSIGDTWITDIKSKILIPSEDDFTLEYDYRQTCTIKSVGEDIAVAFERQTIANRIDGEATDLPPNLVPMKWVATQRKDLSWDHGRAFSDPAELRVQRLMDVALAPPESRSVSSPEIPVNWAPEGEAQWTFGTEAKRNGRTVVSATLSFHEVGRDDGIIGKGSGWADKKTGILIEFSISAKRVPIAGGDVGDYTITLKTTDLQLKAP